MERHRVKVQADKVIQSYYPQTEINDGVPMQVLYKYWCMIQCLCTK